jgi:molybdopterin-guanine dinucleotide biosynthesis protein A
MKTSAFILCAGQPREPFPVPRQLLNIGSEPLLAHTIKQCWARWDDVCVVSDNAIINRSVACAVVVPEDASSHCATISSTSHLWTCDLDRVVVLSGDVLFTDDAMNEIASNREPIAFFTSQGAQEVFAFSVMGDQFNAVSRTAKENHAGRRFLMGVLVANKEPVTVHFILDGTRGFNTMSEYKAFLKGKAT